jgi:hypothetical protein
MFANSQSRDASKAPADWQSPEWVNCSSGLGNCQSVTVVVSANEERAATQPLPHSITTWLFLPFANGSPSEHGRFFVLLFVTAALPDMIHNTRTTTRHLNKCLRDLCVSTSACCVHLAVALRAKFTSLPSMAYWQPQSLKPHEPRSQLSFVPRKRIAHLP